MAEIRWLHLSDIHYMVDPNATNIKRNLLEEIERYFENDSKDLVDDVIITGDFLQCGEYNCADGQNCIKFINEICARCLKKIYREEWKQHVFFCPGNHDLNRNVSYNSEAEKKVYVRDEVLKKSVERSSARINVTNDEWYGLLTRGSFWLFDKTVGKELLGDEYETYGEYRSFTGHVEGENSGDNVVFVGLNTALYAGQMRDKSVIEKDVKEKQEKLKEIQDKVLYKGQCNTDENSVEIYREYLRVQNELINGAADDREKLCFLSSKKERELTESISNMNQPIVVLFGHHPLGWLTDNARKSLASWAKHSGFGAKLYLCGHKHKPKLQNFSVDFEADASYQLIELGIGGGFADESEWNVLSFSINTIKFCENGDVTLNGKIGCMCKYIDEKLIDYSNEKTYGWQYFEYNDIKLRKAQAGETGNNSTIQRKENHCTEVINIQNQSVREEREEMEEVKYTYEMLDKIISF